VKRVTFLSNCQLEDASDLQNIQIISDLNEAANAAVQTARTAVTHPVKNSAIQPTSPMTPVVWPRDGQYEKTRGNLAVKDGDRVLLLGTGQAVSTIRR
jgi:hypothetical protein